MGRAVQRGLPAPRPRLCSPAQLVWRDGTAYLAGDERKPFELLLRFFPAEWMPNLPGRCGWRNHFRGSRTPASNPGTAVLSQSKRFPLVWDELRTPLPTWRALLPETRDPRDVAGRPDDSWVLKPALGRVGEGIGLAGATSEKGWREIRRGVRWRPGGWIAQRRFAVRPVDAPGGAVRPCLGVYVVDGRATGIYGRASNGLRIDAYARDLAVLLPASESSAGDASAGEAS